MKLLLLSLIVFATVFLLSSALPQDKVRHNSLIKSNDFKENEKSLQRKKPPGKAPGPKLIFKERDFGPLTGTLHDDEESKMKRFSDEGKRKKGKKDMHLKKVTKNGKNYDLPHLDDGSKREQRNKHNGKNLFAGDRYNAD